MFNKLVNNRTRSEIQLYPKSLKVVSLLTNGVCIRNFNILFAQPSPGNFRENV